MRQYTVFNVEQADNLKLPPRGGAAKPEWEAHREADKVIRAGGAKVQHVEGDRAYYRLAEDKIVLPERSQFPTTNSYYQTALHECGHSTGHPDRLDRETLKKGIADGFGSPEYAREELRAEISAMMTGEKVGVGHDPARGAAYVKNWVAVLEKDPMEIHRAARDAQRMSDYLIDRSQERDREAPDEERAAHQDRGERERLMPEKDVALFRAIDRADPAGVDASIEAGASLNARQGFNHTALSRAVANDSAPVVFRLLDRGADPNARSESGETPLHHARLASREVFDRLTAAGADPNAADRMGRTPLHLAASDKRFLNATNRLLAAGADPNARTDDGATPLHAATSAAMAERLTTWGADPNAADKLGQTSLHLAVSNPDSDPQERFERVVRLVNAGGDPNARTGRKETPLHRAALSLRDSAPTIRQLLDAGADPKTRDELGNTALHYAAGKSSTGRADAVDHFVRAGAGLNVQNLSGATPLHRAASREGEGQARAMTKLLDNGADLTIRNAEGKTPLDVAASPTAKEIFARRGFATDRNSKTPPQCRKSTRFLPRRNSKGRNWNGTPARAAKEFVCSIRET